MNQFCRESDGAFSPIKVADSSYGMPEFRTRMLCAMGFLPPKKRRLPHTIVQSPLYIRDAGEAENLALYFKKVVFTRKNPISPRECPPKLRNNKPRMAIWFMGAHLVFSATYQLLETRLLLALILPHLFFYK